jgi:hypothetical protein
MQCFYDFVVLLFIEADQVPLTVDMLFAQNLRARTSKSFSGLQTQLCSNGIMSCFVMNFYVWIWGIGQATPRFVKESLIQTSPDIGHCGFSFFVCNM